jgi:hypothetical protein
MLSFVALTVFASFLIVVANVSNAAFAAADFTDFSAGAEVNFLIDQGIINGYEDGTFRPNNEITRAEFTAMLCRAMNEEDSAKSLAGQSEFSDVKPSNWASGYIQWAKDNGIINGVGGGRFDPQGNVTYEQTVKMIVLAMGYEESLAESKGDYPKGYMDIGRGAGLYIDVPGVKGEVPADATAEKNTRRVVAYTMYNAFCDTSFAAQCRKLLTGIIDDGMTELEKEKAIHDYLVLNTAYDYDNYLKHTIPDASYTREGVIAGGVGVCAGYASATKLLMNMEEPEPYPADEIIPTLDEKVLEEMLKKVDRDDSARNDSAADGDALVYSPGYSWGHLIGTAADRANVSFSESTMPDHSQGLSDSEKEEFIEAYKRGWAAGYEIGAKERTGETSTPSPAPEPSSAYYIPTVIKSDMRVTLRR